MKNLLQTNRSVSYGQQKLSIIDRYGVYLSFIQIQKYLKVFQSPFKALDLGCGYNAVLLTRLLPQLKSGIGVDVHINESIKQNPKLQFYEETIEKYIQENSNEKFDVIFMISVLEHTWNSSDILDFCYQMLNPKGILIINVPTWRGKFFLELSAFKLGLAQL